MAESEWDSFNLDVRSLLSEGLNKVFDGKTLKLQDPLSQRAEKLRLISSEKLENLLISAVADARTNEAIKAVIDSARGFRDPIEGLRKAALFSLEAKLLSLPPYERSVEVKRIRERLESQNAARALEPTWQEISGAKRAGLEDKEIEWREKYSFRWLHDPRVRFTCDPEESEEIGTDGEPILRPAWADGAWFGREQCWMEEGIRDAYQAWETSDKKQKAEAWLFGKLGVWNMDWERLVIIESVLHNRFMGIPWPFDIEDWALIPEDWTPES